MIRYNYIRGKPLNLKAIQAAIKADAIGHNDASVRRELTDWLQRAGDRTSQLVAAGEYIDLEKWRKLSAKKKAAIPKPIAVEWSSVKYLFMEIQHNKCAYCERRFADSASKGGSAEHDLEHYRTKNPVTVWTAPKEIDFSTGDASPGYFWLAFDLRNYCASCKTCNSGYKRNQFPIAGVRGQVGKLPTRDLNAEEQPLLVFPLGTVDVDPEDILRFRGIAAFPPEQDPLLPPNTRNGEYRNRRARATITFFALNFRPELLWGRAERIRELEKALAELNDTNAGSQRQTAAKSDIKRLAGESSEHTACVRGMMRLYTHDPTTARVYFEAVRAYLDSTTPQDYHAYIRAKDPGGPYALA